MTIFIEIKWKLVILHSVSDKRARVSITPARTKQPVKLVLQTKDTVVYVDLDLTARSAKTVM